MTTSDSEASVAAARRLGAATVLCVGDLMLDRIVEGVVDRVSPEAPVPVLRVRREDAQPGGAGNVARALSALGARCLLLGVRGDDAAGAQLEALLRLAPGVTLTLLRCVGRPTTVKTRYRAAGQQLLRADREDSAPLAAAVAEALTAAVVAALSGCGAVIVSDYAKGAVSAALCAAVIAAARRLGIPVVVDPKGTDFSRYRGATVLTPNRAELTTATGLAVEDDAAVARACRFLMARCGVEGVLATRSEQGMTVVFGAAAPVHLPAQTREVFDVTGAGDTVIATVAAGLAVGLSLTTAAALANAAAGVAVGKVGAATVTTAALEVALTAPARGRGAVVSHDAAMAQAREWRRRGLVVGFTNGCFDLLHPGHLSLLAQARAACDRLIVGVNSDASVRRLKGPNRPVMSEAHRAKVLAALVDVSLVTVFDEETPLALIRALEPELLVKGADYARADVVGAAEVTARGGRVLLAALTPGQSTTAILEKFSA